MTTTLNTSRSENTMVLWARVSACMNFLVGHVNIALYVRRWVFILYAGEFLPGTKQFEGDIFRVEVFVSPV